MKKTILERYERNAQGELIVNISAPRVEELYNNFDKKAHFLKKDLNDDLVTYLIESVGEIEGEPFLLQFSFDEKPSNEGMLRVSQSIARFFYYMRDLEEKKMREMVRSSFILIIIGVILAFFAVVMHQDESTQSDVFYGVVAEGLTVAAWVSLWEALATFLIKWRPFRKKIALYKEIANAKIHFE